MYCTPYLLVKLAFLSLQNITIIYDILEIVNVNETKHWFPKQFSFVGFFSVVVFIFISLKQILHRR